MKRAKWRKDDCMTRKAFDTRDGAFTEFSLWLRNQRELDSSLGYVATNVDFVWHNYKTGKWMLIEEKRYGGHVTRSQKGMFNILTRACSLDRNYCGFFLIVFSETSPDDGEIRINGIRATVEELFDLLRFDRDAICRYSGNALT